eukprot:431011_1
MMSVYTVVLIIALEIKFAYSQWIEVLASSNACFSASSYQSTIFNAPIDGQLVGVSLRHNDNGVGLVTCNGDEWSNWGCGTTFMVNFVHVTDNTNYIGETYYPTTNTEGVTILNTASCVKGCNVHGYLLNGAHPYANEDIGLRGPSYQINTNDQFMLQYSEACCQTSISDNSGTSCAKVYFLYNKNCEDDGEIKHINWNQLQNADNNSNQIPYSDFTISLDTNKLEMTIDIDLQYVGSSSDGNFDSNYNLGTTYVIDFDSFGTSGNFIDKPGDCQNRLASSFDGINVFNNYWTYSENPFLSNEVGTDSYLSYPPPSEYWTVSMDSYSCTPIHYKGIFSWNDLSECSDYNGSKLISVIDDGTEIKLVGTLYVNLVSPYSMDATDSGIYRSYPLIQQDFEIS